MKIVIVETDNEFHDFLEKSKSSDWVVIPTYCNGDVPVYIDTLSVLYIYDMSSFDEVMLVFNHTEGLSLSSNLLELFPTETKLFVHNKKKFKKFLDRENLIDIDLIEYFYRNQSIDEDFETPAHEFFTRNFGAFSNLNTIIPITKHIEKAQSITRRFLDTHKHYKDDAPFKCYNEIILNCLHQIESNGLFVNYSLFKKKFEKNKLYDNFVYSEYNTYTTTGRPSNRYGGINYAALKKDDGSRLPFVSRHGENGFMISFDYDAYHLRLLADLVDYQFPKDVSVHHYLGTFYFSKKELSEAEYHESKSISFRQLYGGIGKEYLEIPFFAKVHEYTNLLWEKFNDDGYIETPMFSRKLMKTFFSDMNPSKLLNYLLQGFETERNMAVLHNLTPQISSYSTRLILYTYDSFLFDFDKRNGGQIIHLIKRELEQDGKYPVKIEVGPDYGNMQAVKMKI